MLKMKIFLFAVTINLLAFGQKPVISSIDKTSAGFSDVLTIKGHNFGTDPSKLKVSFGPSTATIKSLTNQLVQVVVPAGATFDNIAITNTSNGLTGYSPSQFQLSFGGNSGLATSNFAAEFQKASDLGLYDLALGDFNGDNLTDVVCASDQFNSLAIMVNGSTPQVLNFTKSNSNLLSNIKTFHITAGDLNGDGKIDIVASEADGTGTQANRIIIYKNNGNFQWGIQAITLTGRKVKRVAIADLDLDGKPEIVVSDKGTNVISILPNQSSLSAVSFASAISVTIPDAKSTDALEIKDMNGDGSPEIITSQFNVDNSNVFVCSNKSTPGNFNLNDVTTFTVNSSLVNIRVGDLDGDQKPDVVATRLLGSDIVVFRNTSSKTQITFGNPQFFRTNIRPWGLDLGDLDGDGKLDIVAASIDNTVGKTISVLNNKSTIGSISFGDLLTINTQYINRHIKIGDMDGDAKPDIVFASIDDNANGVPASKVSILRNTSCLTPTLNPIGPLTICTGNPLQLTASNSPGTTYEWKNGSTILANTAPQLDVNTTGSYSVKATSENGACQSTSNAVSVTVSAASSALGGNGIANPTSNSPVCTGSALQLNINDLGASEYRWSGPTSFFASGLTPTRPNFTNDDAGIYTVDIINGGPLASGGCIAKSVTLAVENVDIPTFTLNYSGGDVLCSGTSKVIGLSPVVTSGFSFQWFDAAGAINGSTNATLTVNTSGQYYAQIKSTLANCDAQSTASAKFTVLSLPVPAFTVAPSPVCTNINLTFSNQTTVDANATATYSWTFGDGQVSELQNPTHTYTTGQTYPVLLSVDYAGLTGCKVTTTKNITVFAAIKPAITTATPSICDGESKDLKIDGTFNSITWNTGATGSSLKITKAGTYSATTVDTNGCGGTAELVVSAKPAPTIAVSADKTSIPPGQSAQLTASGADTYLWTPAESLDNPTSATPKATPTANTTYTVKGTVTGGCTGQQSIDIIVNAELLTLKVTNVFTPNGDGKNDTWVIPSIDYYQDCTLVLYDKNGSKVFEQKGYKNDWDGTYKGQPAPEGTYYFVLGCPDKKPLTGNVLLAR